MLQPCILILTDDILAEVIAKHCHNLTRLALICKPLSCPNKNRLTDLGLIDFIEDSVARNKIETLDLGDAVACNITLQSIVKLRKLPNLRNLSINENHFPQNELTFDEFDNENKNVQIKNLTVQLEFVAIRHPDYLKSLDILFPSVETLTISNRPPFEGKVIPCSNWAENVKILKCDIDSYRRLKNVLKNFPNLVSLTIVCQFKMVVYSSDLEQVPNKIEYLEIDYTYAENRNAIRTLFSMFPKLKHFKSSVPHSDTFWKNVIREESKIKISVNEFSGSKGGWNLIPDLEEVLAMV